MCAGLLAAAGPSSDAQEAGSFVSEKHDALREHCSQVVAACAKKSLRQLQLSSPVTCLQSSLHYEEMSGDVCENSEAFASACSRA